jgi:DNA-binding Xre family transcriptional regulator
MHIGNKIEEVLALRHMTKQELGRSIGMTGSTATYLTTRASIDVAMLEKVGNVLKYNFFKHYKIEEELGTQTVGDPNEELLRQLQKRCAELEGQLEACKRDLAFQKQENVYLKKINDLLEKKS